MDLKKIVIFIISFFTLVLLAYVVYIKFFKTNDKNLNLTDLDDKNYSSNIIKDVKYITRDKDDNEYTIQAKEASIDLSEPNKLYLTSVYSVIKLRNSEKITIISDFGKYNSENFDTIFSKNVIINYNNNKISSDYLDFSLNRNSMIISKNVVYNDLNNILKADAIEMNIKTKDTKIFMYEENKKINIESIN